MPGKYLYISIKSMEYGIPSSAIDLVEPNIRLQFDIAFKDEVAKKCLDKLRRHSEVNARHCQGVAWIMGAMVLGTEYGQNLPPNLVDDVLVAGGIHDIGKRHIKPEILESNLPLTEVEWELIRLHPFAGYVEVQSDFANRPIIPRLILEHHSLQANNYPSDLLIAELAPIEVSSEHEIFNFCKYAIAIADQSEARAPIRQHSSHAYRKRNGSVGDIMQSISNELGANLPNRNMSEKVFKQLIAIAEQVLLKTIEYYKNIEPARTEIATV